MTERVLVVPAAVLDAAGPFHGFTDRAEHYLPALLESGQLLHVPRDEAEHDPSFKQLIPYVVLRHQGKVFHYQRTGGGEKRLHARRSVGIGGHICADDGEATAAAYRTGMLREVSEEVELRGGWQERCIGLIYDGRTPVGEVHLGVVHVLDLSDPVVASREPGLNALGFATAEELRRDRETFETWSQFLLDGGWLERP